MCRDASCLFFLHRLKFTFFPIVHCASLIRGSLALPTGGTDSNAEAGSAQPQHKASPLAARQQQLHKVMQQVGSGKAHGPQLQAVPGRLLVLPLEAAAFGRQAQSNTLSHVRHEVQAWLGPSTSLWLPAARASDSCPRRRCWNGRRRGRPGPDNSCWVLVEI